MAALNITDTKLTLKYPDNETFTFSKFQQSTDDENLYAIAKILNAFQNGPMKQVIKVTTSSVL